MLHLTCKNWSFDKDLQILQADVTLIIEDTTIIDEPLCIDVGLPALLLSVLQDVEPNRWAPADQWQMMPFFVCGCGDPECRAFSFMVRHMQDRNVELVEVEERQAGAFREMDRWIIPFEEYRERALQIGREYLQFVEGLDYKPYFADTINVVRGLMVRIEET